jgi:polyphenol oxidase
VSSAAKPSRQPAESDAAALTILRADAFAGLPWLVHGFSTRSGGVSTCFGGKSLNLGAAPDDTHANVKRNRDLFVKAVGALYGDGTCWSLAEVRQVHSAIVHSIDAITAHAPAGDGILSNTPGLLLAIKTADCVPVLIADVNRRVVGAFHAGWRGTVARIVEKGVGEIHRQFGSDPHDLRAAIGPCIRKCCYSVGGEVRAEFDSQFPYAAELFEEVFDANAVHVKYPMLFLNQRAPGHGDLGPEIHLDLVAANRLQLEDAGVPPNNISVIGGCTACDIQRFFSHRAEGGRTGRMMAVIGIKPD